MLNNKMYILQGSTIKQINKPPGKCPFYYRGLTVLTWLCAHTHTQGRISTGSLETQETPN